MPKKNPPNAFMLYVFDRRREVEKDGEKIQGGVPGAVARFGDEWKNLPKERREPYERKAKAAKAANRGQSYENVTVGTNPASAEENSDSNNQEWYDDEEY